MSEADHPSAKRYISQLADYEAGVRFGLSLDQAFGLVPASGGEYWWRTEDRKRRDMLLAGIARDFFSDEPSEWRQAVLIADKLDSFRTDVWPRYRGLKRLPGRYAGTIEERMFLVLKCDRDEPRNDPRQCPRGKDNPSGSTLDTHFLDRSRPERRPSPMQH